MFRSPMLASLRRRVPALVLPLALCCLAVQAPLARAQVETDPERIKEFVARFLKERKAPENHHIIRRTESMSNGVAGTRTDEFIARGETRYWKMEDHSLPREPVRVKETLVMRDAGGRLMLWETDRPAQVSEPGRDLFASPLGFLPYPGAKATGLRLDVQGERAVLDYADPDGRRNHTVLDLARGNVTETLVTGPGEGNMRRNWVERFDNAPRTDPTLFDSIRTRLDGKARQTTERMQATGLLMWAGVLVGAVLPMAVALWSYRRRLQPPTVANMAIGVGALIAGLPLLVWILLGLTQGMLAMVLTAFTWPLVESLPRDIALALSQGLNALVLSGIASSIIYRLLALLVLRRQRPAGQ